MTTATAYPRLLRATSVRTKRARAASGAKNNTMDIAAKKRKVICFSDFDGTIFMQDTGHILFDRYGCGSRRRKVLDDQIKSGKRGFKAASEEMWGSLRVPFDAAIQTLKRSLRVDQDFEALYAYCSAHEVPFSVISAGLKQVLKQVLDSFLGEKEAKNIDIISNDAIIAEDGSQWRAVWRHDCNLGHDKAKSLKEAREKARSEAFEPVVMFIGDGVSDLPAASAADILFARRGLQLERHCVEHGIAYIPYDTFGDIQEALDFVLKDLQDAAAGVGSNEGAKPWRRVGHKNKVSFALAWAQCQMAVRTPTEAAAPAA